MVREKTMHVCTNRMQLAVDRGRITTCAAVMHVMATASTVAVILRLLRVEPRALASISPRRTVNIRFITVHYVECIRCKPKFQNFKDTLPAFNTSALVRSCVERCAHDRVDTAAVRVTQQYWRMLYATAIVAYSCSVSTFRSTFP